MDQAAGLRRLIGGGAGCLALGVFGPDAGLSALALANLAYALARRGDSVWLMDEVPAPDNIASQFGAHPRLDLGRACRDGVAPEGAVLTLADGVRSLQAPGGTEWLASISEQRWHAVSEGLAALPGQPQWLMVHARPRREDESLALCAEDRLLVVPERKSALTEGYAVLKAAQQRHGAPRWRLLVMQSRGEEEALKVHAALDSTAKRFLGIRLDWFGAVPRDERLQAAKRSMRPVLASAPGTPAAMAFRGLAERAVAWSADGTGQAREFWMRMWLFSRLAAEQPAAQACSGLPA
jgi:flagellar biosynthesis protein FlhG